MKSGLLRTMFRSGYVPWLIAVLIFPAAYTIIGLQALNGTLDAIGQLSTSSPRILPRIDSNERVRTVYTGLGLIDETLTNLVLFFWNVIDGTYAPIAIFALWMAGQIVCVLVVTTLEGYRKVNHKKAISYFSIWGILYQNIPWGVMMPIYYALHLVTSPTAQPHISSIDSKSRGIRELVHFDTLALRVLPFSVLVGCILPTALLALPSSSFISHDLRQVLIAFWQPFPVWVGLCQVIFTACIRPSNRTGKDLVEKSRKIVTRICTLSLSLTLFINVTIWYFIIVSGSYSWGESFGGSSLLQKSIEVFVPVPLSEKVTVETLPKGCLSLLQYDAYFACGASLIWACVLYCRVVGELTLSDLIWGLVISLICGPGGAALFILWSRDEKIFDRDLKKD
ncbi:hypothetical protein BGW36DRAFT_462431 [Talaromyces proteolyticus]|uniref:Uncharacterized protein n=1 Tax=Talaromyces proteolyticus TaxID=1131652 RepID=A0AAD4KNE9_9EURO|nr:uncharacterized protein BGW36DRAFT_462431 [Talaromyces proteolyticus]KAH8696613.1 hypothetical protein BGW36DRAFT_462431 [Talaromyces proteolyticus]